MNEKGKTSKGVIALLIVLIIMVLGLSAYTIYDKVNEKSDIDVKEKAKKDELPKKNSKYTYIDSYNKTIKLNGKKHKLLVYYYKEDGKQVFNKGDTYNNIILYKEVYLDNKKIVDIVPFSLDFSSEGFIPDDIYETEEKYIKDTNKLYTNSRGNKHEVEYLVYQYDDVTDSLGEDNLSSYNYNRKVIIVDENSNVLEQLSNKVNSSFSMWFELPNSLSSEFPGRNLILSENGNSFELYKGESKELYEFYSTKIYYIESPDIDYSIKCYNIAATYQEYEVKVENGKVIKTAGYPFKGSQINGAGGC